MQTQQIERATPSGKSYIAKKLVVGYITCVFIGERGGGKKEKRFRRPVPCLQNSFLATDAMVQWRLKKHPHPLSTLAPASKGGAVVGRGGGGGRDENLCSG
jgi:hypothetical protein